MAPPLVRRTTLPAGLLSVSVVLLLAGCSPWWQRQPADRDSAAQQQCRAAEAERLALERQRQADTGALVTLAAEPYQPSPAPRAPDPELASRYSQLDRELDDERYASELEAWRQREQQRRQRWSDQQRQRRQRLQQRLDEHSRASAALEPRLKACRGSGG